MRHSVRESSLTQLANRRVDYSLSNQPKKKIYKSMAAYIAHQRKTCPFEDLSKDTKPIQSVCPFHQNRHEQPQAKIKKDVKVKTSNGTFQTTDATARLLKDVGGGDRIRQMTTRFYANAFRDQTLQKFMFEDDGAANHGQRLGDWIIQKMGGEGDVWSESGRHSMRTISHVKAWNSDRRDGKDIGERFKLDDCRIWMRLMFLSAREVGLDQHKPFWNWYVGFIKHFIAVYEGSAPAYVIESSQWSANASNIKRYTAEGYKMNSVIGKGRYEN